MAESGHTLVWGGTNTGLMEVMASGVQEGGGRIVGVSLELWKHSNHPSADEMVIARSLGERKAIMLERSDALAMLAGGIGTLDEVTEVIELKRQGHHSKPLVILNTGGFYDGLCHQLERMETEGFLEGRVADLVHFCDEPDDALTYLERHVGVR